MDESQGDQCPDVAGKHHGVLKQAPIWKPGAKNNYRFDGRTIHVASGDAPGSTRALTVAFWMKPATSANGYVISKGNKVNRKPGWAILLRNAKENNTLRFRIGSGYGGWFKSDVTVKHAYKPGKWVYVTCTFAGGVSRIYLDGQLKATRKHITWSTPNNLTDPLVIGRGFKGTIDDLRIYRRALNFVQIQNLANGNAATGGLVGYWPMDRITDGTVRDHVHGNNLAVKGTVTRGAGKIKGGLALNRKAGFLQLGADKTVLRAFALRFDLRSGKQQNSLLLRKTSSADRTPSWSVDLHQKELEFQIGDSPSNRVTAANAVPPKTDCDVVVTCAQNTARIYVNGKLVGAGPVKLQGHGTPPVGGSFDGRIDHIRLYSRSLSQEQIRESSAPKAGLMAQWDLDRAAMQAAARQPKWTAGKHQGAIAFNGVNDYVTCNPPASTSGAFTIACWIKPEAAGCLFSRLAYDKAGPGWAVLLENGTHSLALMRGQDDSSDDKQVGRYPHSFIPGQWTHVALTKTNDLAVLYLNGQKVMWWHVNSAAFHDVSLPLLMGALRPGVDSFKGAMDDVYLYDRALTGKEILALSATPPHLPGCKTLAANSPQQAACSLAKQFWHRSDTVVVCDVSDYRSALAASALAARLKAPLLYSSDGKLSEATRQCAQDLSARRCIFVGAKAPQVAGIKKSVQLADAVAVVSWMKNQGMAVDYLAAANPQDRTRVGAVRKSSLAAPLLAAGHSGAVALLDFDTQYKRPIQASAKGAIMLPGSVKVAPGGTAGKINLNGQAALFTVNAKHTKLHLFDTNGKSIGTYETGDRMPLGNRMYTVALDPESGKGTADVWLTWPGVPEMREALRAYYHADGRHPQYLCLLGWPDVIPQAIIRRSPGSNEDLPSDVPLANTDSDPFVELALGRIIGEDVYSTILTATRGLVYNDLKNPSWTKRLGLVDWSVRQAKEFEDYGFANPVLHTSKDGHVAADSPITDVAAINHGMHSWRLGLGGFMDCESRVLFAPAMIESSGCSTMQIDHDKYNRSVAARLLRDGAVCVAGNIRNGIAQQELYRSEFWNAIMQHKTVGQAHRYALNRALLGALANHQTDRGGFRYQFYIRALYGDPDVHISIPSKLDERPAHFQRDGSRVIVYGPSKWHIESIGTSPSWHCKHDKVYTAYARGVGKQSWFDNKERHIMSKYYYTVELKTDKHLASIRQLTKLPKPLGWSGKFWVDKHQDGTRSIFWRVRIFNINDYTGKTTEPGGPITFKLTMK